MKKIEWMSLTRQFHLYEEELFNSIKAVCREGAFSGGKYVEQFEKEFSNFCNIAAVSCVNSGTSALFLALKVLGIKEGDEVIVPTNTFIASAWAVSHNNAKPVFVDMNPDTFEIDEKDVANKITKRTKAIMGVHLYGQPFEVDAIKKIAKENEVFLVEDCAQAHGAVYKNKMVGSFGSIAGFSFYPGKNLGAYGEGGAVVSNNSNFIEQVDKLKNHGSKIRYHHDLIGYNMRMDGIQGAILSTKLKYLPEWTKKRRYIASRYLKEILNPHIKMQMQTESGKSVFHLFVIEVEDREEFIKYLKSNHIGCGQHYPIPCHLQNAYYELGYKKGSLPVAEYHAQHCVSLPMYPELTEEEIDVIIDICNKYQTR